MLKNKYLIYFALISSLFAKEIIAVLDFETIGLNPGEAKILTQRLTTKLISIGKYEVVERTNMDRRILCILKFTNTSQNERWIIYTERGTGVVGYSWDIHLRSAYAPYSTFSLYTVKLPTGNKLGL